MPSLSFSIAEGKKKGEVLGGYGSRLKNEGFESFFKKKNST